MCLAFSVSAAGHRTDGCAGIPTRSRVCVPREYQTALRHWLANRPDHTAAMDHYGIYGRFTVLVQFVIGRDGTILDAKVLQSSGNPVADRIALEQIREASGAPPFVAGMQGETPNFMIEIVVDNSSDETAPAHQ
ncbi:energy transducer TonB [Neotabrizicola sp. VNH66]|uniref:energy transducer TonB n=1 Tax=Neotabrizicola sp. VNH66 TaxID=3400918 RepID=UPI003C021557